LKKQYILHLFKHSNLNLYNRFLIKTTFSLFFIVLFLCKSYNILAQENNDFTTTSPIQFLSEYIRIPSVSGNENQAAYFLMQACEEKGLYIYKISDTIGSVNFAASLYPLDLKKPNIIFHNHMDVVPAGDSCNWNYPPYSGTIANGKVWGRGSLDNKGLAIIQLFTIEKFVDLASNKDLPYNVTIVCVSGEETGGFTGSAIVSENFKEIFNPVVVIGEGGAGMDNIAFLDKAKIFFGISITEKSSVWLKLSYNVQSAGHASIAGSDYAYKRLIKGLHKLIDKQQPIQITNEVKLMFSEAGKNIGGIKGFAFKNLDRKIFRPTIKKYVKKVPEFESMLCNTITVSSFGEIYETTNQTPMEVHATLDCRLLPGTSTNDMIDIIYKAINDSSLNISILKPSPPAYTSYPDFFFHQLSISIKKIFHDAEVIPMLLPASTDNSYYRASGCPVFGLNPMIIEAKQMNSIHNFNEYIDIEDINNGILIFEDFLQSLLKPI